MDEKITYFGYGSLVNDATRHDQSVAVRGTLRGYVREWRIAGQTPRGRVCGLTASPKAGTDIKGVMVIDSADRLGELDQREWRYDRHGLHDEAFEAHNDDHGHPVTDPFVYRCKDEHYRWGDDDHPIIQTYVDCVLKGYLDHFGEAGVHHFIDTTDGWQTPIWADRQTPFYARAMSIDPEELRYFDEVLTAIGVRYMTNR